MTRSDHLPVGHLAASTPERPCDHFSRVTSDRSRPRSRKEWQRALAVGDDGHRRRADPGDTDAPPWRGVPDRPRGGPDAPVGGGRCFLEGLSPFSDVPELPKPPDVRVDCLRNDSDAIRTPTAVPAPLAGQEGVILLGPQPVWGQQARCPGSPIQGPGATSGTPVYQGRPRWPGRVLPSYCVVQTVPAGLGEGVTRSKGGRSIR